MPKNYVDNKKLYEAIVEYKRKCKIAEEEGKEKPRIPEYVGACILEIATHLSKHPWFNGYSYKDDMISKGVQNVIEYFDNFDPEKTKNPFAYFTQIIYFAFQRAKKEEEKHRYGIYKYFETTMMLTSNMDLIDIGENNLQNRSVYDNITEFIEKFEKKVEEEKKRKKRTKSLTKYIENEEKNEKKKNKS